MKILLEVYLWRINNMYIDNGNKIFITLVDTDTRNTNAIIVSCSTTAKEISDIFDKVKSDMPGEWDIADLLESLPDDCVCTTRWNENMYTIYY